MTFPTMTGGCQCGRVRFSARPDPAQAYLCHCRMCKKATGGFAAAFVDVPLADIGWASEPDWYDSSPIARRAFCSQCGTPLGFRFRDGADKMDLTIGSFDDPTPFRPVAHSGAEAILPDWLDTSGLPRHFSATTPSVAERWRAAGMEVPQ